MDSVSAAPKVSIVITAYNSGKYISETIDSFITQTYGNWEMIIVNDGSTDDTLSIIREYEKRDERIFCIDLEKNAGMCRARKTGADRVSGKYLLFFDSDDIIYPGALETLVNTAEVDPETDIVAFLFNYWHPNGSKKACKELDFSVTDGVSYLNLTLRRENHWMLWCNFMRTSLFLESNVRYDYDLCTGTDLVFFAQLAVNARKVIAIPYIAVDYRVCSDSACHAKSERQYLDYRRFIHITDELLKESEAYPRLKKQLAKVHVNHCTAGIYWGFDDTLKSDLKEIRNYLLRYPSLWKYLFIKHGKIFLLMLCYFLYKKKAISVAYKLAERRRLRSDY